MKRTPTTNAAGRASNAEKMRRAEEAERKAADEKLFERQEMLSESNRSRVDSLSAWLLATLVAVNTSGAGATLLADGKGSIANKAAAVAFATGICLAILSGVLARTEASRRATFHYYRSLKRTGDRHWASDSELLRGWRWTKRIARAALTLNLLSLAAFAVGCIAIASVDTTTHHSGGEVEISVRSGG
jgi:hypothetical protein